MNTTIVNHSNWYSPFALRALCITYRLMESVSTIHTLSDPEEIDLDLLQGLESIRRSVGVSQRVAPIDFELSISCLDPHYEESGERGDTFSSSIVCSENVMTFKVEAVIYGSSFEMSSFSINFEKGEIEGNYPLLISWEGHTKQILNEVLTHIEYKFEETSRA